MVDPLDALRVEPVARFEDARGALIKAFPGPVAGEVYLVALEPGATRGQHLHRRAGEQFTGVLGEPVLLVADPASGRTRRFALAGQRVSVPAGLAHAIVAPPGQPCLVAAAMDRAHDPDDVVPFPLEGP